MDDLAVFVIKNKQKNTKRSIFGLPEADNPLHTAEQRQNKNIEQEEFYSCVDSIVNEIDQFNINCDFRVLEPSDIPSRCQSNLICLLDESMFIPNDFLNRVASLNNIFRDAGLFCGPTLTRWEGKPSGFSRSIEKNYYRYYLNFGNTQVADITTEQHNYPSIIGSVISGLAYNQIGFSFLDSGRSTILDNRSIIQQISRKHKVYYCANLLKYKYLYNEDLSIENLSEYYYGMGYQDGLLMAAKQIKEKHRELWHKFVASPELLDNEMPRWLYKEDPEAIGSHLEKLVLLKCKYQIGMYEGMLGQKLI